MLTVAPTLVHNLSAFLNTVIHKCISSFQRHNLVNVRFKYTKISRPEQKMMLCEVRSEFSQSVLFLPCNVCISVTSL